MLRIYNTLASRKQTFRPAPGKKIRMYVCGVTVYDFCHIGHARSAIVFDVIRNYLKRKGYSVRYVRNFTDVDDKIIHRAQAESRPWKEVSETYIRAYREDMKRLGVRPADREPKATEQIPDMIRLIESLLRKKYAYVVEGSVYYRVRRFKKYGRLSKRDTKELQSGARVEIDERKEDPLDFALWKASKPGEPAWKSPWGPGRPGWHIECSAMAMAFLGRTLDIHGGGKDLVFPHHENEIAQSEAATGRPFSRYWIHNGFVTVDREKMSKSLGNFFTIREIFEKSRWPQAVTAEVLRYLLVSTHYRSPIDFSDMALDSALAALDNFYLMFQKLDETAATAARPHERKLRETLKAFPKRFEAAMDDDFNTASAVSELHRLRAAVNMALGQGLSRSISRAVAALFRKYGSVLGLFSLSAREWTPRRAQVSQIEFEVPDAPAVPRPAAVSPDDLERLINERDDARRRKDWARADQIRKLLTESGIVLEDRPDGTTRIRR